MSASRPRAAPLPLTVSRAELLTGGRDDAFRALITDMLRFGAELQAAREALAHALGVTPPQYTILMAVARSDDPGGPTVSEVAAELEVSVPFIVTQSRALVAAGLLCKQADKLDRRRVRLLITSPGRRALVKLASRQRRLNDTLFAPLSRADFKTLQRVMRALLASSRALDLSQV